MLHLTDVDTYVTSLYEEFTILFTVSYTVQLDNEFGYMYMYITAQILHNSTHMLMDILQVS